MADAFFDMNTIFHLERHSSLQSIANCFLSHWRVIGDDTFKPQSVGGFYMRRDFIEIKHTFVPTDYIAAKIPFPDTDATRFIGKCNALHQAFIHPLGMLEIINIFNLRD